MEILEFIQEINVLKNSSLILNHVAFITSLLKLNNLIGMEKIKETIISQIKYYLINKSRNSHSLDSHMFHTTVLGPPGCGKTTLVEILAEIWICLGILKSDILDKPSETPNTIFDNQILSENVKLTTEVLGLKLKMEKIKKQLINERIKLNVFKKNLSDVNKKINNKDIKSIIFNLERLTSSMNKNIKNNFEEKSSNYIEKVEDSDYPTPTENDDTDMTFSDIDLNLLKQQINFDPNEYIIKLRRDDLVGKYVGHTAIKTREALMKGLNKIIFIDEAYELYNTTSESSGDSFGMECLSTILNFMNEYSDKCIIVFAGYEDLLNQTIFRVQPGLKRRIQWSFILEDYTSSQLVDIYEKQLKEKGWILNDKQKLPSLFEKNKKLFKFGGGDCLRLCLKTKIIYSNYSFKKLILGQDIDSNISYEMVAEALELVKITHENEEKHKDEPPFGMYL